MINIRKLTVIQCYSLILRPYPEFGSCPINVPHWPDLDSCIALGQLSL